jgi:hypothetical protein
MRMSAGRFHHRLAILLMGLFLGWNVDGEEDAHDLEKYFR